MSYIEIILEAMISIFFSHPDVPCSISVGENVFASGYDCCIPHVDGKLVFSNNCSNQKR